MTGQIGHRELVGAIAGKCDESAPQRASTARKCTVRTTLAPSAETALLLTGVIRDTIKTVIFRLWHHISLLAE